MSKIQSVFQQLHGQKAFIPYITAGDPDLEHTLDIMHSLVANGADILELGVPFSDPMADGPTIQRAAERALANGVSLNDVLDLVKQFRQTNAATPVVLMGYLNPIHKMGYDTFAQAAQEAGVDGVLTVDSPIETIEPLHQALKSRGLDTIFLIAPTTEPKRMQMIAERASGFVYYVSLKGVTGSSALDTSEVATKIALLRQYIQLPIAVGFGISDVQSVRAIGEVADAVIVGSRMVREIEEHPQNAAAAVGVLAKTLKDALPSVTMRAHPLKRLLNAIFG